MEQEFIVAEITKNWINSKPADGDDLIRHRFETVLAVNKSRGYLLKEWRFSTAMFSGVLTETIIAIFQKVVPKDQLSLDAQAKN
jgi:hypothetical protein